MTKLARSDARFDLIGVSLCTGKDEDHAVFEIECASLNDLGCCCTIERMLRLLRRCARCFEPKLPSRQLTQPTGTPLISFPAKIGKGRVRSTIDDRLSFAFVIPQFHPKLRRHCSPLSRLTPHVPVVSVANYGVRHVQSVQPSTCWHFSPRMRVVRGGLLRGSTIAL